MPILTPAHYVLPLDAVTLQQQYLLQRFEAELNFAVGLCDLNPAHAESWQALIQQAYLLVKRVMATGSLIDMQQAVHDAETLLLPLASTAKTFTIHCVGHAHIDMNWMWSWPETVAATNDSFLTVLRFMDEYPGFCFSQSQASVYAIIERHHPALLERIKQRVTEGRWEVIASHWVETDKNLVGGEALTRHLLYTRQYMQQLFNLSPEDVNIDWSPDTFGHAVTVPTYLCSGGVKYLYLHRPGVQTPVKPEAFWWQAPDNARVLVRNDMRYGYNQTIEPALATHLLDFAKAYGAHDFMSVYGVGDHGGGPTRRDIERVLDMASWPIFPVITFSTTRKFFTQLEKLGETLPTVSTELNMEFSGCYTSQSLIKKAVRFGEMRLKDSEAAASMAWVATGFPYPTVQFRDSWTEVLFNHFHDILPGSGVHDTRTYSHGLYQKTMAEASQIEMQALRRLASQVDTSFATFPSCESPLTPAMLSSSIGAGVGYLSDNGRFTQSTQHGGDGPRPFLFFNSTGQPRHEVVQVTIWEGYTAGQPLETRPYQMKFSDGSAVPAQFIGKGDYWGHQYVTLALPVEAPALGYVAGVIGEEAVTAKVTKGAWQLGSTHHCTYAPVERLMEGIENDSLRLEIDATTGGIHRLIEKSSGKTFVLDAPLLEYAVERPHGMSAWSIEHSGPVEYPTVKHLKRKGDGPYTASLEVGAQIHESEFIVTYELRAGDPQLYVHITGTWFQRGTALTGVPALTYALPLPMQEAKARYEIPFGAIDRDFCHGEEVPALHWAQVNGAIAGQQVGCLLCNDSKHGYSLTGNILRLSLIRATYDPDNLPEIGNHEIHLTVCPFVDELAVADATRTGNRLNQPIRVVSTDLHQGVLPTQAQLLSLSPDNVILSAIKKDENENALVIRLFETAGKDVEACVSLYPTFIGKINSVLEVDLMERPLETSTARIKGDTMTVQLRAHGISSLKLLLDK